MPSQHGTLEHLRPLTVDGMVDASPALLRNACTMTYNEDVEENVLLFRLLLAMSVFELCDAFELQCLHFAGFLH